MRIDLNADVGGSYGRWTLGDDEALLPHVTSANICCGYHAGDPHVMRDTAALAVRHGAGIGAHVGLPDLMGYGRRRMAVSPDEFRDFTVYQVGALWAFARAVGGRLQHVKPHGAMYHMAAEDAAYARAIVEAIAEVDPDVILLLRGDAVMEAARAAGVRFVGEGYVDLDYAADGSLVTARDRRPSDPRAIAAKAVRLVTEGRVRAVDGSDLALPVQSICVHGDRPNAVEVAKAVRLALANAGVDVVPLAALSLSPGS